jgi:hypothetical protein
MEASDEETKWNFESSGDESGTAAEAPAVVLPKPKKPRSKAQLAAFEKARATRAANILKKKEAKSAPAPEPVEQPPARTKKARKKQRVVYEESSDQEESSSDEDVLLVRRRKKPKPKPVKKPKRKPRIVYESDLDSSSGDDRAAPSTSKVSVPQLPQFYVY